MKLIGVGFGRSGTMSLKAALEELGAGPCFHMIDLIIGENKERDLAYWVKVADGSPSTGTRSSSRGRPRSTGPPARAGRS